MRRGFGFSRVPAALGAFLLTFASSRVAQLGHHQLWGFFYVNLAVFFLVRTTSLTLDVRTQRRAYPIYGFFLMLALMAYSSIYWLWFFSFVLLFVGLAATAFRETRALVFRNLRTYRRSWCAATVIFLVAIAPLFKPYLSASRELGAYGWDAIQWFLPSAQTWVFHGKESWLYGWMKQVKLFQMIPIPEEKQLGFGVVTFLVSVITVFRQRKTRWVRVTGLGFLGVWLVANWFPGDIHLWSVVDDIFPAAHAMRVVSRVGIFFLFPAAWALAFYAQKIRSKRALALLLAVVVAEQLRTVPAYPKQLVRGTVEQVREQIFDRHLFAKESCIAFLLTEDMGLHPEWPDRNTHDINRDAMYASLDVGLPTLNGYSTRPPPGWEFDPVLVPDPRVSTEKHAREMKRLRQSLKKWTERYGLTPADVCWIHRSL